MVYPNRLWIILKIWLEEHIANLLGEGMGGSDYGLYHELGEDLIFLPLDYDLN